MSLLRANHPAGVLHPCQPISVLPVCQRTNQRPFLPTAEWFYFRQAESGFCCRAASRANTNACQKKYTPHRVELVGEEIQIRAREIKKWILGPSSKSVTRCGVGVVSSCIAWAKTKTNRMLDRWCCTTDSCNRGPHPIISTSILYYIFVLGPGQVPKDQPVYTPLQMPSLRSLGLLLNWKRKIRISFWGSFFFLTIIPLCKLMYSD